MHHNRFTSLARVSTNLFIVLVLIFSIFLGVTQKAAAQGNPKIVAIPNREIVDAVGWTLGNWLTLEIDDPATPQSPDYQDGGFVGVAAWDPNQTYIRFNLASFDLKKNFMVTMNDSVSMKLLIVSSVEITFPDVNDLELDRVRGTADPGSSVRVHLERNNDFADRQVATDAYGFWVADFSTPGPQPFEQSLFDVGGGVDFEAMQDDADGDTTRHHIWTDNPTLLARANEDRIEGNYWPLGSTVSVEIDDPLTGQNPDKTVGTLVGTAPWDPNQEWFEIQLTDYDLKPNDVITAMGGGVSKQLTVKNIAITNYDLDTEFVHGTADPGQLVFVQACGDSSCANRDETTDQDGNWIANFAVPGEQDWEQGTADLQGGIWLDANIDDEDGDMSRFGMSIPNPAINVLVNSDRVGGNGWPLGETLIIEIDDPTTIYVNPDFEATSTVDAADWDPNQTWFEIGLDGYDLKTGDIVTISGGGFSKQLTIQTLAITEVDLDTDTVYGVAEPNQQVEVVTCYSDCINQNATADQDGNWFSSFSSVGDESANIRGGSWVAVVVHDEDDDTTRFGYGIPNPTVTARANDDAIEGYQWPLGETVVLEIDDPNTPLANPDYTQSTVATAADWDPNQTWLSFQPISYDIKTGDIVTVSDGSTAKQLVVANLAITEVDLGADVVHGTADPDQPVSVSVCGTDFCIFRDEIADSSGNWSANFAVPSPGNGPEDTIDIQSGIWIDAFIWDEDSDTTSFGLTAAPPACLPGNSVSGTVFEHDGTTPVPNANVQFENFTTGEVLLTTVTDANGQYGCNLPSGNYRALSWPNDGYSSEYYLEAAGDNATELQITTGTQLSGIDFTVSPLPGVEHLTFNFDNPLLQDLVIRKAIALGTNRQQILTEAFLAHNEFGTILNSIVPLEHWASAPVSELETYSFDPVQAQSLLAAAGWTDTDNDGFRENAQGVELSFTFKTTPALVRVDAAELIRQNMEAIGIRIIVETVPAGEFFGSGGTLEQGDFDIAEFAWVGGADNEPYLTEYLSTSTSSVGGYSSPSFDAAIANARAESGDAGKLPFLYEAQGILTQDLPSFPLFTRLDVAPVATDPGTDVTVSPETYLDITFDEVIDGGVTTVLPLDIDPADLPPNFEVLGQVYDVGTNAQFTSAQVCFSYDDAGLTQAQEDAIRLFHLENNVWVDVTDAGYPDTVNNLVCGTVTSFSPFAIVYGLNQAPQITSLSAPLNPTQLGQTITATALFDDPDAGDTHTALFDWGDGSTTTLPASTPSVSAFHTYAAPGVYTITVTVTDAVGESDSETFQYIVVYDPNGGFVTGGGWITSPLGAYTLDPSLTGKATFGFVSKYQKGANVPTGNTEFQFHVAGMSFRSTAYDWLVIAGSKAQYKGTGTINGSGEYKFMLTAIDGSPDKFRIKIWDASTGDVVYDNQLGAGDTDDPVTAIQGGSIVIHKPK